jgi:hypothetical protein
VPSALIMLADLSPLAAGRGIVTGTLAVADEVVPAAKPGYATLVAVFMLTARRLWPDMVSPPSRSIFVSRLSRCF